MLVVSKNKSMKKRTIIDKIMKFLIKKGFTLLFLIMYVNVSYEYLFLDEIPDNFVVMLIITGFMYIFNFKIKK